MSSGNQTYSAIFDLFTYWGYSIEAESGTTLKQILAAASESKNSSEEYYQALSDAIERYPELADAKFMSPSWEQKGKYHSETYGCVFELPNGDKYVAYRGTEDGGWIDNGQGMSQKSTLMQEEAAQYFDQMAEKYGWTEEDNIYVTGHSKGGNKAQYVTLMSNHANLVDECHSFNGQGFSDEAIQSFKEKYGEAGYQEVLKKMYGCNGANDYVNPLGHIIIPKENIRYIDTVPNADGGFEQFAGWHMEEQMFQRDENGDIIAVLGEQTEQGEMGQFSVFISEFLMSLPPEERRAGAMVVMQVLEMKDVLEGGGAVGVDGTTVTSEEMEVFLKKVLPKLLEELGDEAGINKEVVSLCIRLIELILIAKIAKTKSGKVIIEIERIKERLRALGGVYEKAAKVLDELAAWITEKIDQIANWFQSHKDTSSYQYFYVETSRLLAAKAALKQQKAILEEKANRVREIRKQVDFGAVTQQQLYFCLTSTARMLEKEAGAVSKLSNNLQKCVSAYKQNEQKVIGIYGKCGG